MEICKKCGGQDIGVRYIKKGENYSTSDIEDIEGAEKFAPKQIFSLFRVDKEHLIYTCRDCSYRIAEKTKTTSVKKTPSLEEDKQFIKETSEKLEELRIRLNRLIVCAILNNQV